MSETRVDDPVVSFLAAIPGCRVPIRADPSALGTLPTRGFQYCESLRVASSFGWYVFPPIDFTLQWDGSQVLWTYSGADSWFVLKSAQFPGYKPLFDSVAPAHLRGYSPPFLTAIPEAGIVQIWTGWMIESAANWSVLVRAPANIPRSLGFDPYEGIIETDRWFGPLFTNIRLVKTDVPITFSTEVPLVQVQPLLRDTYAEEISRNFNLVTDVTKFSQQNWARYEETIVKPNLTNRPAGAYAVAARRRQRQRGNCPMKMAAQTR